MTENQQESNQELDALLSEKAPLPQLDWQALLDAEKDAELLENPVFTGKSLRQLLSELSGAQSLIGRKGLIKPKDDDDADVWNAFYKKLGKPDKAEDYAFDFSDVEASDWYSDEMDAHMRGLMHEAGLTSNQAVKVASGFKDFLKQGVDENQALEQAENVSEKLSDIWGDDFEVNEAAAERGAREIGLDPATTAKLLATADPVQVWDTLARIGKAQSEDTGAGVFDGQNDMSPADAAAELERLRGDKDHVAAFLNVNHPHNRQVRKLRSKLVRLASS